MASKNIVHQYFRKELKDLKILVKVDPIYFKVTELSIPANGAIEVRLLDADASLLESLEADGFVNVNGMEFNLYDVGLLGGSDS